MVVRAAVLLAAACLLAALDAEAAAALAARLAPLHQRLGPAEPGSWRARFPEPGQTFAEYRGGRPNLPTPQRRTICLVAAGALDAEQRAVVDRVGEFMAAFYGLPLRRLPPFAVAAPGWQTRTAPDGGEQVRTDWFLDRLAGLCPADAVACLALTPVDLWPGEGWNFVFGQATLQDRTGVWSLARLADPQPRLGRQLLLRRMLKIALHETGHMFSIEHCTAWRCLMQGSNTLAETDAQPLDACPECTAKIVWMGDADPAARYRALAALATASGLGDEAANWNRLAAAVAGP